MATAVPWIRGEKNQRVFHEQTPLTTIYDFAGGNFPIYVGEATPGSLTSSAVWRIQKRTYTSNKLTKIEWAEGDARFKKIWDDRASLSYS